MNLVLVEIMLFALTPEKFLKTVFKAFEMGDSEQTVRVNDIDWELEDLCLGITMECLGKDYLKNTRYPIHEDDKVRSYRVLEMIPIEFSELDSESKDDFEAWAKKFFGDYLKGINYHFQIL